MVADGPRRPPHRAPARAGAASGLARAAGFPAPLATALAAPFIDSLMMPREQHLRHPPAAVDGRTRVLRVLRIALECRAEGLLDGRVLVSQRAGELAKHRVAHHHRSELSPRQDEASDRDHIGAEVLDDALVEALVAPAQQR